MRKILALILSATILFTGCQQKAEEQEPDKSQSTASGNVGEVKLETGDTYAVIKIKDYGDITVKLFADMAPTGTKNFIDLANSGYYSGKNVHRVIADFMFQGGSQNGDGMTGENAAEFGVEANTNMRHFYGALCYANAMGKNAEQFYIVNNKKSEDLSNYNIDYMQQSADAYLEASKEEGIDARYKEYYEFQYQYNLNLIDYIKNASDEVKAQYKEKGGTPGLDGNYTVFGQTVDGFDVIDKISEIEVSDNGNGEASKPKTEILISSIEIKTK